MIRIGLVGFGYMGSMHAACYKIIPGAELVAVAGLKNESDRAVIGEGVEIYSTGMELIENADVDVIDICLPTYLHTSHAVAAMKKGRNVFLEKPACLTREEAELLLKTQEETGATVQVGHLIRFWDEYKYVKEVYDERKYGEIVSAIFRRRSAHPAWTFNNWIHDPTKSGTVVHDMHIHDADFVRYLLGEPDRFTASAARDSHGLITHFFSTFFYKKVCVSFEACWDLPEDFSFDASFCARFEKAAICLEGGKFRIYYEGGGSEDIVLENTLDTKSDLGGNISDLGGYYNELKYFIDKISKGEEPEIAPLSEGIKSVLLMLDEVESVGGAQI